MMNISMAIVEEIKQSRKQTLQAVDRLASQLHQAQLLLEKGQEKEAAESIGQALHQRETISLNSRP